MSVSFWCPDAPRKDVTCPYCAEARSDREDYIMGRFSLDGEWVKDPDSLSDADWQRVRCEPWCQGTRMESESPDPNFANANARAVLQLLGMDAEYLCGSCDAATMRQRLFVARNSDRSSALRDGYELSPGHLGTAVVERDGIPTIERRGCGIIEGGNTDAQTLRRLDALDELATYAQENSFEISWG